MAVYGGIDLHSNNSVLALIDAEGALLFHKRYPNEPEAIKGGLGTLVVAMLAYVVMGIDVLEHLVFVFPELLLPLLAGFLLAGRYTGYRLSELARFRALGGPAK